MPRLPLLLLMLIAAVCGGCAGKRQAPAQIEGVEWRLESIDGEPPRFPDRPTLRFDGRGHLSGTSYVNQYSAACVLGPGTIRVDAISTARKAGPPDLVEEERVYLARLRTSKAWRLRRETLTLTTSPEETLRFTRGP